LNKPEILAPAGDIEKLKTAIRFGADAVYCAGQNFGLRAYASNFDLQGLNQGIVFAHRHGAKVYVTANIYAHNQDLEGLAEYLNNLNELGVDGLIISDPGIIRIAKEVVPDIPLHISTQANTTNWSSVLFWEQSGVERVVLARELSFGEIKEIRSKVNMELEAFVHGAMCISYSGRCLLSNYMVGRDANKGECAQACRWSYQLVESKRPEELMPIEEDRRGTYIFNSKDLCLLEYIPQLVEAGLNSFKIEGRMKSVHYVATVVRAYRIALDKYMENPDKYHLPPELLEEVSKVSHRGYTTGFFFKRPESEDHNYVTSKYVRNFDFIGVVKEYDELGQQLVVEQRNNFKKGDLLEILPPKGSLDQLEVVSLSNYKGEEIDVAPHPQQIVRIPSKRAYPKYSLLRRKNINE